MIRQNLLVLGLALIAVTGCASTMSQNCGSPCSVGKQSHKHHHRCRGARCRCRQSEQLFPGDAWGQPVGSYPMSSEWAMDECGGCDSGMMQGGCSSCESGMSTMPMMMHGQGSSGCNCGGQHSAGMHMSPMMMSPHVPMNGTTAPAVPPAVFEAPKPGQTEQNLPPVPNDGAPVPMDAAPAAAPVVDPVSWESPVFFPMN
jgi:hypothetical protein